MGFRKRIRRTATDRVADATDKHHVGFDPEVCLGCANRGDGPLAPCGLCGCPTVAGLLLDRSNMVPDGCPRIEQHDRNTPGVGSHTVVEQDG